VKDIPGSPPDEWLELAVEVDVEAVEPVSELFARYGYNEGVVIEEPFTQEGDGDNLRLDTTRPITVRTYLATADLQPAVLATMREALWHLGHLRSVGPLKLTSRREEDWANAWKAHFHVHRIGEHVVVRAPWHKYEPNGGDDVVVELDPGMAFGTGLHPSTKLCMVGLEREIELGDRVLDVGTGSGILAIAAVKLGAGKVDALDIEPVAVRSAVENAERNGVANRVTIALGSVGEDHPDVGTYDLVLANIIARILIELAPGIAAAVAPAGRLVLSGIIETREAAVLAAYQELGLALVARGQIEDWIGITMKRDSKPSERA